MNLSDTKRQADPSHNAQDQHESEEYEFSVEELEEIDRCVELSRQDAAEGRLRSAEEVFTNLYRKFPLAS